MSFELLVGPPGSGKTRLLMERAVELANQGKRVWWAGLPTQRAYVYRLATRRGALLGLEFQTLQQVYYRLLAHARRLEPLVVGTGRLALIGEALAQEHGAPPSPGEARLFAAAVAEAKRYGVAPSDLPDGDPEIERFRAIYLDYERLKGEAWDYDDFRVEALRLAECGAAALEAQALVVAGFRELSPLDLRLLALLGDRCDVLLALPQAPPGFTPSTVLERPVATVEPATLEPAAVEPAVVEPRTGESQAVESPSVESPSVESPAVESPAGESPSEESASGESPAVESQTAEPSTHTGVSVYTAPNPVSESRWVLNSLKRDLAGGLDPLELAVILPRGESVAFAALADEYGVPTMDESPLALADSGPGRLLLELLELPDYPTASRLLPIRELAPLADAALEEGVAGYEALDRLAQRLGLEEVWRGWLARLQVPGEESTESIDDWASDLVDLAIDLAIGGEASKGGADDRPSGVPADERARTARHEEALPGGFRDQALLRAKEAQRVAVGEGFRAWWVALLNDTSLSIPRRGGVALLDERQASGRRFRKAYLMRATEGSYGSGEREDYFVPEELRLPLTALLEGVGKVLPRRFEGRDSLLFQELLEVADELVVTYPSGNQSGPLLPEPALLAGARPLPLPPLPVASSLELTVGESYRAPGAGPGKMPPRTGPVSLEELRRFDECPMRYWLEGLLDRPGTNRADAHGWWHSLRHDLLGRAELDAEGVEELANRHPQAGDWLLRHRDLLIGLSFGVRLPHDDQAAYASLDAAVTRNGEALIYKFAPPARIADEAAARKFVEDRWTELWAAGYMLERFPGRITRVRIFAWPALGNPIEVYDGGIGSVWGRIRYRRVRVLAALEKLKEGSVEPAPGYRCRDCSVRDVCREAAA